MACRYLSRSRLKMIAGGYPIRPRIKLSTRRPVRPLPSRNGWIRSKLRQWLADGFTDCRGIGDPRPHQRIDVHPGGRLHATGESCDVVTTETSRPLADAGVRMRLDGPH